MGYSSLSVALLPALVPAWIWMSLRLQQRAISFTTESWASHYDYIVGEYLICQQLLFN